MGEGHWLSRNPDKAWAERFFLLYSPVWMAAVALVILTGWIDAWGDLEYLAFGIAIGLPALCGPWFVARRGGHEPSAGPATWLKLALWCAVLVAFGTYFGTAYFFDLMGMRYGFPVSWTFEARIVGRSAQTVPVFMYPLTQAYFVTYFVGMTVVLRRLETGLRLGRVGRIVAVLVLAYGLAWMETFAMASDHIAAYFQYADKARMLRLGSLGYAAYFVVGLPMFRRIDEHASDWPLHRVLLEALAACMLILCLLEAWAHIVGPL
jgi:cycloeucalenol cycloisomerase